MIVTVGDDCDDDGEREDEGEDVMWQEREAGKSSLSLWSLIIVIEWSCGLRTRSACSLRQIRPANPNQGVRAADRVSHT